jgi:predicted DNA-binding antitoxin AbrB/MazE fold protein
MKLYHYFEKEKGPFNNLSDLRLSEAEKVLSEIRGTEEIFASKRDMSYMKKRFEYKDIVRKINNI